MKSSEGYSLSSRLPAQRGRIRARDANFDRHWDGLAGIELSRVDPRARHFVVQRSLDESDQIIGIMLVLYLDDDLRIVQLLKFARDGEPEPWPAATNKGGERFKDFARLPIFPGMRLAIFLRRLAHDFFSAPSGFIRGGERCI